MNKIGFSKLTIDPTMHTRGYIKWLQGVGGYYYTAFVHDYQKLTINELKYAEQLLISDIRDYYTSKNKAYHLEENSTSYSDYHKTITYFVKLGLVVKGKALLDIQQIGDSFNIVLVYATRSKYGADAGLPNHFRNTKPKLSLYTDESLERLKRRQKNRHLRKKGKNESDTKEFNKIHTANPPKRERPRQRYNKRH